MCGVAYTSARGSGFGHALAERSGLPLVEEIGYATPESFGLWAAEARISNPNELVIEELFPPPLDSFLEGRPTNRVGVEFVSRYRIPETALETIGFILGDVSPATIRAFQDMPTALRCSEAGAVGGDFRWMSRPSLVPLDGRTWRKGSANLIALRMMLISTLRKFQ